jgi:uncharacterized protein YlxW (UPF0749 family)
VLGLLADHFFFLYFDLMNNIDILGFRTMAELEKTVGEVDRYAKMSFLELATEAATYKQRCQELEQKVRSLKKDLKSVSKKSSV